MESPGVPVEERAVTGWWSWSSVCNRVAERDVGWLQD